MKALAQKHGDGDALLRGLSIEETAEAMGVPSVHHRTNLRLVPLGQCGALRAKWMTVIIARLVLSFGHHDQHQAQAGLTWSNRHKFIQA
jgi:hypothetical protein